MRMESHCTGGEPLYHTAGHFHGWKFFVKAREGHSN